ncbi:hypothetical protein HY230_01925 [Candidatus Acetothermia bacterium]|nr:hypothetical protein [Candidatus Acetothermia bacterium]
MLVGDIPASLPEPRYFFIRAPTPKGTIICIDEGQRIGAHALSALKNVLQHFQYFLIVLSLRLVDDTGGAIPAGRNLLDDKARAAEGDYGASRFFSTGIAMGPFSTDNEASNCLKRRLKNNAIQFDNSVIQRVIGITGRVPREMISLAMFLHDFGSERKLSLIKIEHLREVFCHQHVSEVNEAKTLCNNVSDMTRQALAGLVQMQKPASAEEIVHYKYSSSSEETKKRLVQSFNNELTRVSRQAPRLVKIADNTAYQIADTARAYALEIALQEFGL